MAEYIYTKFNLNLTSCSQSLLWEQDIRQNPVLRNNPIDEIVFQILDISNQVIGN